MHLQTLLPGRPQTGGSVFQCTRSVGTGGAFLRANQAARLRANEPPAVWLQRKQVAQRIRARRARKRAAAEAHAKQGRDAVLFQVFFTMMMTFITTLISIGKSRVAARRLSRKKTRAASIVNKTRTHS